ncbi:MAG: signal transduction histidine kinase, LytS, partial [Bacteroidetes bacterium]|nr:signal transduction histidine kinase, LytS [Bacteroidota bacterium]
MASQLITDKSFRWSFAATGYVSLIVQAVLLQFWFHFPDSIAWVDSGIHIGFLALAALTISYSLAYYRPQKG